MPPIVRNLLAPLPAGPNGDSNTEVTSLLARAPGLRLEQLVSHGHPSSPDFWYDQPEDEWVALLRGTAVLAFEDSRLELAAGDSLTIPARQRHRVEQVSDDAIWIALHFNGPRK
jgi:cupin 2 domain-containing protein